MKSLWQIEFMDEEKSPFHALSNIYTMTLKCSRYQFSYEDFDVGVKQIDDQLTDQVVPPFQKNDDINDEANDYLEFSESNPFGSISETDSTSNV
jgi:hypothetical protein